MPRKLFYSVVIYTLALTFPAARALEIDAEIAKYWNSTSMNQAKVANFINNENCYQSDMSFVGCLFGLNALLAGSGKDLEWTTHEHYTSNPTRYESIEKSDLAPLILGKLSKPQAHSRELSPRSQWQEARDKKLAYESSLLKLRKLPLKIDFEKLSQRLISQINDMASFKFILGAAINTYLQYAYDPHTEVMPEKFFQEVVSGGKLGTTFGIGVEIEKNAKGILVLDVSPKGPADSAGIRQNEILVKADDVDLAPLSIDDGIKLIRGEKNSLVKIKVLSESGKIREVTVQRGPIAQINIRSKVVDDHGNSYAYIQLKRFLSDKQDPKSQLPPVCQEFIEKLNDMSQQAKNGLIIDLRGNGGGDLMEVTCMTSLFIGSKVVAFMMPMNSLEAEGHYLFPMENHAPLPLVILINGRSASASEIMAGALQDYQRAWIVGEQSFGKATVQTVKYTSRLNKDSRDPLDQFIMKRFDLGSGFVVKKTTLRYFLPSLTTPQITGVRPDFVVPFKPNATDDERFVQREGDMFETAFREVGPARRQSYSSDMARMTECMNNDGSKEIFENRQKEAKITDYQLLRAQEVLNCAKKLKLERTSPVDLTK